MIKQKTTHADGTERAHPSAGRLLRLRRMAGLGAAAGALVLVPALTGVFPVVGTSPASAVRPVKPHVVKAGFVPAALSGVVADGRQKLDAGEKDPRSSARAGATTAAQDVPGPVSVVGVSWPKGAVTAADTFQVRTFSQGTWSDWQTLDSSDIAADANTAESRDRAPIGGTDPYVVAGASKVQVRVLTSRTTVPTGAQVSVIDPGTSPDPTVTAPGAASADAAQPQIYSRAAWGADESIRKGTPDYGQVQMAFVHHTDGSNTYTSADVPAIIRGIYAYHVLSEGWNDIGYNFLVDRFGRIWEGRYGGIDKAVIGAQTLNYNTWSTGVAAIGTFTSATPPPALLAGIERVLAWKLSVHGIPAVGSVFVRDKYFNRISGHRDGYQTACPGQALYDQLPTIRTAVRSLIGSQRASALTRAGQVLTYPGTAAPPTMTGPAQLLRMASPVAVAEGKTIGTGWNVLRNVTMTADLTGDGQPDVVAVDPRAGTLRIYRTDGHGGFTGVTVGGSGWQAVTRLVAVGDWDGDGHNDLLGVNTAGQLVLYSGDGAGWFRSSQVIGTGWGAMSAVFPAGDVTHDGSTDLYAVRSSDGALMLYPHLASGAWGAPQQQGGGWSSLTATGGLDLDHDGNPGDILARDSAGHMRTYYADASDKLSRSNVWGAGWTAMSNLSSGVDLNGDGTIDLLAVNPGASSGALMLYAGTGRRDLNAPGSSPGPVVPGADWVRIVGDVDHDGYPDALARMADGTLVAMKGTAGGTFGAPFTVGSDWQYFDLIEPAGDLDNDGVPDLMARMPGGELYIYPMTSTFGFKPRYDSGSGWQAMRSLTGVGSFNTDTNADVVALRASDGALLLYRGGGPGTLVDSTVLATGQTDLTQVLGMGDVNGDGTNDVVARDTSGNLWLYAGNGTGGLLPGRQPLTGPQVSVLG
ncbi:FG-GAP-like repeat-containing protein [Pedococcus sp.]|uniref:FG-GAP-like repeat-containing protein n=1 Tax=Pedococcus sp. TaxID=2860345 RepID=UPI002E13EE44|nr:FG-GAP-like repeat-containing protein [Pedococcus sp.]